MTLRGTKQSAETIEKRRKSLLGRIVSEETKEKIRQKALGRKCSDETKQKIREANLGKEAPEHVRKLLLYYATGKRSFHWKGKDVGYRALHRWIEKKKGKPHFCQHCKQTDLAHRQYHWANISQKYRRDVTDWIRLCALCHKRYDRKRKTISPPSNP